MCSCFPKYGLTLFQVHQCLVFKKVNNWEKEEEHSSWEGAVVPRLPCGSPSKLGLCNRLDPSGNPRSLKVFLSPRLLFGYLRNMGAVAAGLEDWNLGVPGWFTQLSVPFHLRVVSSSPAQGSRLGRSLL